MEDDLKVWHEFATAVADALNEAGVKGPEKGSGHVAALMACVFPEGGPESGREPIGGSFNYVDGKWTVMTDMQTMQRIGGGGECTTM